MYYRFICTDKNCGCEEEKNIPVADYDREKEKQICSNCGAKMQRLLEWSGIATSSNNNGWFGKSDGSSAI
jgi:predicted nucleic acid-binding Zn ribbon protein